MTVLPETILQFGAGNFLRAFADLFVHEANEAGQAVGRIVVVQSTDSQRAAALNQAGATYHVVIRGLSGGQVVDEVKKVASISRALTARSQWDQVLAVAASPDLRYIISNTTEAGYNLAPEDTADAAPPRSFPAKLASVLRHRFEAGLPAPVILPCELIENNGSRLKELVTGEAVRWGMNGRFLSYLGDECVWLTSLVDRIVTGRPAAHPLLAQDPLLTVAEPYALWAISADARAPLFSNPAMKIVPDVTPFSLRKIRILNGGHTALAIKAEPLGIQTVREAVTDPRIGPWLRGLLFEEIVPVVEKKVESAREFAEQVLERFANPFVEHKLSDIRLHHEVKIQLRLVPTFREYTALFGRQPPRLAEILHGYKDSV